MFHFVVLKILCFDLFYFYFLMNLIFKPEVLHCCIHYIVYFSFIVQYL